MPLRVHLESISFSFFHQSGFAKTNRNESIRTKCTRKINLRLESEIRVLGDRNKKITREVCWSRRHRRLRRKGAWSWGAMTSLP